MSQVATYSEIERFWTLTTVLDANDALTLKQKAEQKAQEAAK